MAWLKNADTGAVITRYVNFNKNQELTLTVQTALDGTEYLTRFGKPVYRYELELYVDEKGKDALMAAADSLALLEVSVRIGVFSGRVKTLDDFERVYYGWYKTKAILSPNGEVSAS